MLMRISERFWIALVLTRGAFKAYAKFLQLVCTGATARQWFGGSMTAFVC
ncbi:hypothetical protein Pan14r_32480 [Crateriforma conspicua]|uniref:Uncharacterized protein n=1 Tax=Crateriforma conspicua TaxID=2527996 RepID=A0A5C5Y6P6_9PLAN|nr:hypothetical protein Mal65_47200 [Crateriforma conspicua]TWT70940.1 hypothetical protein Pan14r_32480 [Crateriforma conspicua]